MAINRRRVLLGTGAAAAALSWPAVAAENLVVTTYGGRWEKFWRAEILPGFRQATGIDAVLDVGLAKNFMANLRAAGQGPAPYSVVMTNANFANALRTEGLLESIPIEKTPNLAKVFPFLRNKDDNGVRGLVLPLGLGYNRDLVKTPPRSWADLWSNPEFKGRIGLYQIGNSAALLFLLLTARLYGGSPEAIDVAFGKMKELLPFQQVDFSGTLATLLGRGDVLVAPVDIGEIVGLKQRGLPVEVVVPSEGTVAFEQSFDVPKNAPAKEAAYKYIDYMLSAEVQMKFAREFSTSPTNIDVTLPPDLEANVPIHGEKMSSLFSFDWTPVNATLPAIVDRWNREMK